MIVHDAQHNAGYTLLPNSAVRDERLTLAVRGLLARLLSYAPTWQVTVKGEARRWGADPATIRGYLRTLEACGYVTQTEDGWKVIRRRRVSSEHTPVLNATIRDPNLPLSAVGLLMVLLSNVDGWKVTRAGVSRQCGVSEGTAQRLLRLLADAGYLTRDWDLTGPHPVLRTTVYETPVPDVAPEPTVQESPPSEGQVGGPDFPRRPRRATRQVVPPPGEELGRGQVLPPLEQPTLRSTTSLEQPTRASVASARLGRAVARSRPADADPAGPTPQGEIMSSEQLSAFDGLDGVKPRKDRPYVSACVAALFKAAGKQVVIDKRAAAGAAGKIAREWPDVTPEQFAQAYLALRQAGRETPTALAVVETVRSGGRPRAARSSGPSVIRATSRDYWDNGGTWLNTGLGQEEEEIRAWAAIFRAEGDDEATARARAEAMYPDRH